MSNKQCQRLPTDYQVDVVLLQHLDSLTDIKNVQTMICVVMQLNSCTLRVDIFLKLSVFCIDMSESHNVQSSAVDRGFDPRLGQTEDNTIGICWFTANHAALRRKSKDWLGRNNVSQWSNMSTHGLFLQCTSTIKIHLNVLVQYKADLIIISLKINLFSP